MPLPSGAPATRPRTNLYFGSSIGMQLLPCDWRKILRPFQARPVVRTAIPGALFVAPLRNTAGAVAGALLLRGPASLDRSGDTLIDRRVEIDLVAHELGERERELQAVDGDALGKLLHGELQLFFDLQQ